MPVWLRVIIGTAKFWLPVLIAIGVAVAETAPTVVFPGIAYLATWPRIVGCLAALLRLRGGDSR